MKKDIEIPIAKDVHVAIVHEWNEEFLSKEWNTYVLNNRTTQIDMVLIVSKGYDEERKTSTMRHAIGVVEAKSYAKIEMLQEELFALNNEFFVTYYAGNYIYENGTLQFFSTPEGYVEPKNPDNLSQGYDYIYQYTDHLGNIRLSYKNVGTASTVDLEIQEENNYYPFGLKHKGYNNVQSANRNHKYGFGGKEEQDEVGLEWLDFGARNYDSAIGRWMNLDPLAEDFSDVSPYNAMLNNPINFIDPDGRSALWVPDSEGNLIAEAGDSTQSLADYQGISYTEAAKQLEDQGYTIDNKGILSLKIGDKVELDNVFTESIDNSTGGFSTDVMMGLTPPPSGSGAGVTRGTTEDNYNCWGSACAGSQGKKIDNTVGIALPTTFDTNLTTDYTPATSANASFGKTVLRFADGGNNTQHGAVFYGKSKNGTTYVYSKNGWHAKPEVMKLSDLQTKIPSYGTVQGLTTGTSGYYDPN